MVEALDAEMDRIFVGEGPADVVVTADVVNPGCALGQVVPMFQRLLQQIDFARRQTIPQQRHLQRVVGKLAFLGRDVAHHVVRMNDGLGFEQQGRCSNAGERVVGAQEVMRLWLVLAGGTHLLPDESHRIHAQELDAKVGDVQHLAGHRGKHRRIAVVQVPLIAVEGRPHPAPVRQLRKSAGVLVREDFAQCSLVGIRLFAVRENVKEIVVLRLTRPRATRPFVLVRGMVEHEVEHQRDAFLAQLFRQLTKIGNLAERRLGLAVAADSVTAVAVRVRAQEGWHQVQIGQPEFLEVRNLFLDSLEGPGEQVDVADTTEHLLRLEPVRVGLALFVERLEILRPHSPCIEGHAKQLDEKALKIVALPEERLQFVAQRRQVLPHTRIESGPLGMLLVPGCQGAPDTPELLIRCIPVFAGWSQFLNDHGISC